MSLQAYVDKMTEEHVVLEVRDIVEDVASKPGQKRPQVVSRAILKPVKPTDKIDGVYIVTRKLHDALARAGERTCIDWFGHQTWSSTNNSVLLTVFTDWYEERTRMAQERLNALHAPHTRQSEANGLLAAHQATLRAFEPRHPED